MFMFACFILMCLHNYNVLFSSLLNFNIIAAIAAEWQEWGEWSGCTASCGEGSRVRARACSEALFGGDQQCSGNSTEAGHCEISECEGIGIPCTILVLEIFLQLKMPNGKYGASGPNAAPPVATGLGSGLVLAVNRSLEVKRTVLEILQRLDCVRYRIVQQPQQPQQLQQHQQLQHKVHM